MDEGNTILREAKNVKDLSKTKQLEDMLRWTENNNFRFYLHFPEGTNLSGPLQKLIDEGRIIPVMQSGLM